jgi:hypothetical protein
MIRRYYATKDNSITNAYQENLTTRGTGSNMGASDVLEVFSIYGQESSTSSELMRTIIQFDTTQLVTDRASGKVPASGSVSWYLKMFNAPHSQTVPSEFDLIVSAVSGSWEEGYGLDMDFYEDLTKDGIGSNWINAKGPLAPATATLDLTADITLTSVAQGRARNTNTFKTIVNAAAANPTNTILVSFTGTTAAIIATITPNDGTNNGSTAVNLTTAELVGLINTGVVAGKTITITDASSFRALQTATGGGAQNLVASGEGDDVTATFSNGDGKWVAEGGDYYVSPTFTQSFPSGLEDMELDVSELVEQWMTGSIGGGKDNHGFGIKLPNATETAARSFFTKKFFGRDSEFFFQRPVIEARWDSARRDDRADFRISSSAAPAVDNLNTLFLYNRPRGVLSNLPAVGTGSISVNLYSSLGPSVAPLNSTPFTGSHLLEGIYQCEVFSDTVEEEIFDVWFSGSVEYFTGSISPQPFTFNNQKAIYVLSMPNLRKEYRKHQSHELRLYVREKNWSPNIYTEAIKTSIPSLIIPSASYQIRRDIDDYVVVPYGTGSTLHTAMSYDVSGNYFELDTSYLETGYLYDVQYSFYDTDYGWQEQPYRFTFRVVD